jgi:predicted DNA-binding protein YlxM (UPF0122 family)
MSKAENLKKYISLYDIYKLELTEVQREVFELYYFEDYSLNEIAEVRKSTRAAVHDSIKKSIAHLERLESNIGYLKLQSKVKLR